VQQPDERAAGAEGVGHRAAVGEAESGPQLAVDLGHEQRLCGQRPSVQRRQALERGAIVGVGNAYGE